MYEEKQMAIDQHLITLNDNNINNTDNNNNNINNKEIQGHTDEVSGLFIDIANIIMVSSGFDGYLIFWDFASHKIKRFVNIANPVTLLQGFKDNNLVAIASQDRIVRVFDMQTFKLTRLVLLLLLLLLLFLFCFFYLFIFWLFSFLL